MATYPYTSGQTAIIQAFEQLRKTFPPTVDASWLKRFAIAPGNESYIISIIRFLGFIDEEGKKVEVSTDLFLHADETFQAELQSVLKSKYSDLFSEHGDGAWSESRDALATWFRVKDKSSDLLGKRQASTFLTLAALAGHGEVPKATTPVANGSRKKSSSEPQKPSVKKSQVVPTANPAATINTPGSSDRVGLTVRIEVNLPATGTPEVYDAIFASIRKNLIDQ